MKNSIFIGLNDDVQKIIIQEAKKRIVYVSPGIRKSVAEAIVSANRKKLPSPLDILVCLDFNENTLRMGYGDLEGVKILKDSNIQPQVSHGFRSSFMVVDEDGWVFTPTALYLEPQPQSDETPNAMRLTKDQIAEALFQVFPPEREQQTAGLPEEERNAILNLPYVAGQFPLEEKEFTRVEQDLQINPPVEFDTARLVRVFESYFQYVEMEFNGAKIQAHRVQIPESIQKLGKNDTLKGRLKTTFQLVDKESELSSAAITKELQEIRKDFIRTFGKNQNIILKSARKRFDERIKVFRGLLAIHQDKLRTMLQKELDKSRKAVRDYYLPIVVENKPDALIGQSLGTPGKKECERWLERELNKCFPYAWELINKMQLDIHFKDITFETLNEENFLGKLKTAYPDNDWDKPYNDYRAMCEAHPKP